MKTLQTLFRERVAAGGDSAIAFEEDSSGTLADRMVWNLHTWQEFREDVEAFQKSFAGLQFQVGDRVAYAGSGSYHQSVLMVAAMLHGVTVVSWPDHLATLSDVYKCLGAYSVRLLFVDSVSMWRKINGGSIVERCPSFPVVVLSRTRSDQRRMYLTLHAFLRVGSGGESAEGTSAEVESEEEREKKKNIPALVMFSPGSSGVVRAVAYSVDNLVWTASTLCSTLDLGRSDQFLSVLSPLHVTQVVCCVLGPLVAGYSVWYTSDSCLAWVALRDVQPTFLVAPSDFWISVYAALSHSLHDAKIPSLTPLQKEYVLRAIGCSRLRRALSGSTPCPVDVMQYFELLGVELLEVYGMLETCGLTTLNRPGKADIGNVGRTPSAELEVTLLAPTMEILVRGRNLCLGYVEPSSDDGSIVGGGGAALSSVSESVIALAASEAGATGPLALGRGGPPLPVKGLARDGWFHTGDVGVLSTQGQLTVLGRLADELVLLSGQRVHPQPIETQLRSVPLIRSALLVGDRRAFLAVLLSVDPNVCRRQASIRQQSDEEFVSSAEVAALLRRKIDLINASLTVPVHRFTVTLRSFQLNERSWALVRSAVLDAFSEEIERLYESTTSMNSSPSLAASPSPSTTSSAPVRVEFVTNRTATHEHLDTKTPAGYFYLKRLDIHAAGKLYTRTEFAQETVGKLESRMVENMRQIREQVHTLQRLQEEVEANASLLDSLLSEISRLKSEAAAPPVVANESLSKSKSHSSILESSQKEVKKKDKKSSRTSMSGKSHGDLSSAVSKTSSNTTK